MRGKGPRWGAALGGTALLLAFAVPWFHMRVVLLLGPVRAASRGLYGWPTLGTAAGLIVVVTALGSVVWAARKTRPSGVWLVMPGGLTLIVLVGTVVSRVGVDNLGRATATTVPAPGLALAFIGAAAAVLAGLVALLRA